MNLDCRPENDQPDLLAVLESSDVAARPSPLQRYRNRLAFTKNGNSSLHGLSLFECLRLWDYTIWMPRPRALRRVINYFLRYSSDSRSTSNTDFCRVKLMLHHSFVAWQDLLSVDGLAYASYVDAFRVCLRLYTHPSNFYTDPDDECSNSDAMTGRMTIQQTRLTNTRGLRLNHSLAGGSRTTLPLWTSGTAWEPGIWTVLTTGPPMLACTISHRTFGIGSRPKIQPSSCSEAPSMSATQSSHKPTSLLRIRLVHSSIAKATGAGSNSLIPFQRG